MQLDTIMPPANLPTIAPAPVHEVLLFEQPWPLIAGLLIASVIAAYMIFRNARTPRIRGLAFPAVFLAVGLSGLLFFVATNVNTEREILNERTAQAVAAMADWDAEAFDPMLSDNVRTVFFMAPDGWDHDQLLDWIRRNGSGRYEVESYDIKSIETEIGPAGGARTLIEVSVKPAQYDRAMLFICQFDWIQQARQPSPATGVREADFHGWRIDTIRPLWITGRDLRPRQR